MSLRTALIPVVAAVRAITGPTVTDIRLHQLTVTHRQWSGAHVGDGVATDTNTVLPKDFRVRTLGMHEVAGSGGNYRSGDIVIDNITPSDGAGTGYTTEQLRPHCETDSEQRIYTLVGPQGGDFEEISLETYRPFSWRLVLRRIRQ